MTILNFILLKIILDSLVSLHLHIDFRVRLFTSNIKAEGILIRAELNLHMILGIYDITEFSTIRELYLTIH